MTCTRITQIDKHKCMYTGLVLFDFLNATLHLGKAGGKSVKNNNSRSYTFTVNTVTTQKRRSCTVILVTSPTLILKSMDPGAMALMFNSVFLAKWK